jgi:hypothetical protein
MKKIFIGVALAVVLLNAYSATKCQADGRGGVCCWDTDRDGIFKPIGC